MPSLDTLAQTWAAGTAGWTLGAGMAMALRATPFPEPGWDGQLVGTIGPTYTATATSTTTNWDLTDSALFGPFVPPDPGQGSIQQQAWLHAGADVTTADALWWEWDRGGLHARYRVAGVDYDAGGTAYVAAEHRWWRIRHADGVVTWDLSPDGLDWTPLALWVPTVAVTSLRITLRAGHWLSSTIEHPDPALPARFGALNVAPARLEDPATVIQQDGVPFLAVDVQPDNVTGTFQLDVSDTDSADLLAWSTTAAGTWVNVVCDVRSLRVVRGASDLAGPLTTVDAGLCTVVLSDTERRFDPLTNADAIRPGTWLRVRAWGFDLAGERWDAVLFTGRISDDGLSVAYQRDDPPLVTVEAADLVAELVAWRSAGYTPGIGAGDTLLTRAQRILAEMDLPATRLSVDVDLTAYAASHPATAMAQMWDELTAAKDAELGRVWVSARDQLVVRTRRSELSGPVRLTLSDSHADADAGTVHCCYTDVQLVLDTAETVNRAVGTRAVETTPPVPATVSVENSASVARWRPQVAERPQLQVETDTQSSAWAEDLVDLAGVPAVRVTEVSPYPSRTDLDNALDAWPAVCLTDLGDRARVRYSPAVGPVVDATVGVLGIVHDVTPQDWAVQWLTTGAPDVTADNPQGFVLLDVSYLDTGDVLSPAAAAVVSVNLADGSWY